MERGADLHVAQLMPLPLAVSASVKSRLVLPFWYRLTRVVPDKGQLNGRVCVCVLSANKLIDSLMPEGQIPRGQKSVAACGRVVSQVRWLKPAWFLHCDVPCTAVHRSTPMDRPHCPGRPTGRPHPCRTARASLTGALPCSSEASSDR